LIKAVGVKATEVHMKVLITSGMGVIGAEASRKFVKERTERDPVKGSCGHRRPGPVRRQAFHRSG
jgi:hypothetical protein